MANNKVDSGPFSPGGSQGDSPAATSGERKASKQRRRKSSPVISLNGSEGLETRGHRSQTISTSSPSSSPILANFQTFSRQPTPPMPSINTNKPSNWNHDVDHILHRIEPRGSELADAFWHAPEQPPVTPESLAELDMPRIINNPKLRHDVNFDRELHFRPNLDGTKGQQKVQSAELYWKALEAEFYMCAFVQGQKMSRNFAENEENWQKILSASLRRLPKVFEAVRAILRTLVPDEDQQTILERLDVALIMREISHGVCDLVDLANWLKKVLKNHCAPMRDNMVDRMQREIVRGANEQKPAKLVNGLRQLLSILEAMKLDVANHQIRHMRSILIEDTINFQKRYNAHRIQMGKIDVRRAKNWIDAEYGHLAEENAMLPTHVSPPTQLDAMVSALLRSLLCYDYSMMYPNTFYLDNDRLVALRLEMLTTIYHELCRDVLMDMCRRTPRVELDKAFVGLYHSITAITGNTGRIPAHIENIAVEIMRIALLLEGQQSAYDPRLLDIVEQRLENDLRIDSTAFESRLNALIDRVLPKVQARVEESVRSSAVQLQDRFAPVISTPMIAHQMAYGAVCYPVTSQYHQTPFDPDEDFIRRFTHVAALHWQVWADLIYDVSDADINAMASVTPPASPTVPVAQAVYAPGRRWLPVGLTVTDVPSGLPTPSPSPRPQGEDKAEEEEDVEKDASTLDSQGQSQSAA